MMAYLHKVCHDKRGLNIVWEMVNMKKRNKMIVNRYTVLIALMLCVCTGCGKQEELQQEQIEIQDAGEIGIGQEGHLASTQITEEEWIAHLASQNISPITVKINEYDTLNVATYVTKIADTYYIADCYHNQIIYHTNLHAPLQELSVLTDNVHYAHTISGDGRMFIIDDTENNRVVTFAKTAQGYYETGVLENIGMKPHFTYYDEERDWFMVWSSITGEMYYLNYDETGIGLKVDHISKIDELFGVYVRSFSVIGDSIYFVSGHNNQKIIKVNADALAEGKVEVEESYAVTAEIAGMVQLVKIEDYYYISISTDAEENQDYATWIRTKDLSTLAAGEYEDVYDKLGVAKGTPYYITEIEGRYYMAHHRTAENLLVFDVVDNEICNVEIIY